MNFPSIPSRAKNLDFSFFGWVGVILVAFVLAFVLLALSSWVTMLVWAVVSTNLFPAGHAALRTISYGQAVAVTIGLTWLGAFFKSNGRSK